MTVESFKQITDVLDTCTEQELRTIHQNVADRINYHIRTKNQQATFQFVEGEKVWWDSKYGRRIDGVITKICTKNIKVKATDGMNWTVSASLLKKA